MGIDRKYRASDQLSAWIRKSARNALWETVFLVLGASVYMWKTTVDAMNIWLLTVGSGGIAVIILVFLYTGLFRRARILNATVAEIWIENSEIHMETYGIRILGYRIKPKVIEVGKTQKRVRKGKYPLMDKKNLKTESIAVIKDGKKYYILKNYFDSEVINLLSA